MAGGFLSAPDSYKENGIKENLCLPERPHHPPLEGPPTRPRPSNREGGEG